ncbi:slit homolog 3 protein-like isoform X2 [Varroa destructor]|uniref:Uncharacterized protein n=1 Tax=Varroa destructor TaxID=109461 RepID=A0A7M7MFH5_VARDE|nr:slit homolog 3 protein-like isoform X2 [Varroa destructor]
MPQQHCQLLTAFVVTTALVASALIQPAGAQRNSNQDHFRRCPQQCTCALDINQGKKISCESGGLSDVPFLQMDSDVQVFHFTAPPDLPNEISLGRFFGRFFALEEIRITHSRVPAIGENSFYPLRKLQILDLSHNNISTLIDKDFYGLQQLKVLNLSSNDISKCPSAPFRHLQSLTSLILSNNRLQLAPRLFYQLKNLQRLDLSGNPLNSIDPDILKDLRPVTRLYLARCNLSSLHSLVYQQLPNLEHLDLRDNKLTYLAPHEFRHLSRLQFLHLDGNKLTTLKDLTFDGQALAYLGLSRNSISAVEACAFCNSSISELNLSRNRLESSARDDPLRALSLSIEKLDLSYNPTLRGSMVAEFIRNLHRLNVLNLEGIGLYDLPATTFSSVTGLRQLYLNKNSFSEFRYSLFLELKKLEVLNISHNNLKFLRSSVIRSLNDTNTRVIMHDNPWRCQTCYMNHLLKYAISSQMTS